MRWLFMSILLSVVLTVLLNAVVRLFPGAAGRGSRRMTDWAQGPSRTASTDARSAIGHQRMRTLAPWQTMLLASLGLTILLNVIIRVL